MREGAGRDETMKDWPLWGVHLADQISVLVEEQVAEDVAWAEEQGFTVEAVRMAARGVRRAAVSRFETSSKETWRCLDDRR